MGGIRGWPLLASEGAHDSLYHAKLVAVVLTSSSKSVRPNGKTIKKKKERNECSMQAERDWLRHVACTVR